MKKSFWIILVIFVLSISVLGESKVSFWDTQKKGANCMNEKPVNEKWFKAAKDAGIKYVRLAYDKWKGKNRDFMLGSCDNYTNIFEEDFVQLKTVLDIAAKYDIKIIVTPLSLPGARWSQLNNNKLDLRLWADKKYWEQSAKFWKDFALKLKDHPAVYGYNIVNEPHPEVADKIHDYYQPELKTWYSKAKGTPKDLNDFYDLVVKSIRSVDKTTPVFLDTGLYATPPAIEYMRPINDKNIFYALHMYEPYSFTNNKNDGKFVYPGKITVGDELVSWDKNELKKFFEPVLNWQKKNNIPSNRIIVSEFGGYRRNKGIDKYFGDLISIFDENKWHWAFYAFREDGWDGMDYETGTEKLSWKYWDAVDKGLNPEFPRIKNPVWDLLYSELNKK